MTRQMADRTNRGQGIKVISQVCSYLKLNKLSKTDAQTIYLNNGPISYHECCINYR